MRRFLMTLAGCAMIATLVCGCGKKKVEEEELDIDAMRAEEAGNVAEMQEQAGEAVEQAKDAVEDVKKKGEAAVKDMQSQVDAIVADVKKLIDGEKYSEALAKLQSGLQIEGLTGDQKSMLQKLIEQVQKAMAAGAAEDAKSKLGNTLKGLGGK
jgi:hypothetical protein